jgi:hypothetical protein
MNNTPRRTVWAAAFGIAAMFSWLTISSGAPTLGSPYNLPVVLVALISGSVLLASLLIPIVFLAWCWPVLRGASVVPLRSIVLLVLSIELSTAWHFVGFDYGIQYQGQDYVTGVVIVNILFAVLLVTLAALGRRHPQYWRNLAFHLAFFTWFGYYAFPYLGELP